MSNPSSVNTARYSGETVSEADMRVYAGGSWKDDFKSKMLKLYVCNRAHCFDRQLACAQGSEPLAQRKSRTKYVCR